MLPNDNVTNPPTSFPKSSVTADCAPETRVACPLSTFVGFATLPEVR